MVRMVLKAVIALFAPINIRINATIKLPDTIHKPAIAIIAPRSKEPKLSLKFDSTEDNCETGIESFLAPKGIKLKIVFGFFKFTKFCS